MVRDFGEIKDILQSWVDQTLDHRMILNKNDPLRGVLEKAGEPLYLLPANPTAENIAKRSEEHTSELQSLRHLVCRLLLEKKKKKKRQKAKKITKKRQQE